MPTLGRGPILIPSLTRDAPRQGPSSQAAYNLPWPSDPVSPPRPFLLVVFVLLILALFLDLSLYGPITNWAATVLGSLC